MTHILDLINDAVNRGDYYSAELHLQQLRQLNPDSPWILYYTVCLEEMETSSEIVYPKYQQLLKKITNPKILSKIRQKLINIDTAKKQSQKEALEQASQNKEMAILVLEAIKPEHKSQASQELAKIMQIDPYTAFLQLPTRHWRLYRTGYLGLLEYYTKALIQAQIPAFCVPLKQINQVQVYSVQFLKTETPQPTIQYLTNKGTTATFSFNWREVTQITKGIIPIFGRFSEVKWQLLTAKIESKITTTDYIKLCDLHLKKHNLILRFVENSYQYNQGISLVDKKPSTKTINESWQELMRLLELKCPNIFIWSDFNHFAETAMDFELILPDIKCPNISTGIKDTHWGATFHLYSGLAFFKE